MVLALDVLAQHLVTLAVDGGFDAREVYVEVRATHAFAQLTDLQWRWVLDFNTRGGTALQGYAQFQAGELAGLALRGAGAGPHPPSPPKRRYHPK